MTEADVIELLEDVAELLAEKAKIGDRVVLGAEDTVGEAGPERMDLVAVDHVPFVEAKRWANLHWSIWREEGGVELWALEYETPATEMQEGSGWEYTKPELFRVTSKTVKTVEYERLVRGTDEVVDGD